MNCMELWGINGKWCSDLTQGMQLQWTSGSLWIVFSLWSTLGSLFVSCSISSKLNSQVEMRYKQYLSCECVKGLKLCKSSEGGIVFLVISWFFQVEKHEALRADSVCLLFQYMWLPMSGVWICIVELVLLFPPVACLHPPVGSMFAKIKCDFLVLKNQKQ